jgi:mono/diheme cytochrome c family protein
MSWLSRLMIAIALTAGIAHMPSYAQAQTLTVADRGSSRTYSVRELLANAATRDIAVANDVAYRRPMNYRAVAVADLLKTLQVGADDYVQARAIDGFSVSIPAALLTASGPPASGPTAAAEAFVAIDDPAAPWPTMPGKDESAGPLYIVWRLAGGATVSSEYWAYQLAALTVGDSPFKRWPELGVASDVATGDPVRRGLDRFAALCMACHRFNGAGEGTQGPDLGRPMNPVDYFQPAALKKYIRDPASVRAWPSQKMPGLDAAVLPDSDIDAIVAWLAYKSAQKSR